MSDAPALWPDPMPAAGLPDAGAARAHLRAARAAAEGAPTAHAQRPLTRAAVSGDAPHALGWAVALARAGLAVTLVEPDADDARRAGDLLRRAVARGQAPAGIALTTDPDAARGADLLIDTAPETGPDTAADRHAPDWSAALRAACAADALILRGAGEGVRPGPEIRIDAAKPPPRPGLVEVLDAAGADPDDLDRARGLIRRLGALPVVTPGFIGAVLRARLEDAAEALVFAGVPPWELDEALERAGFSPGPCAAQDLRGLAPAHARHRREDAAGTRRFATPVLARMVAEGRLGRAAVVGWYRYPGGGGRVIDPLIEDLCREEAHFAGLSPAPLPEAELRRRAILTLIDAGADLHAAGIPPALIDLVSLAACGFPARLGGPMFLGAALGFARVADSLAEIAAQAPAWAPGHGLRALSIAANVG